MAKDQQGSGGRTTPDVNLEITGMKDAEALELIGQLINSSQDMLSAAGTDRAFAQLAELKKRNLAPALAALAHYFQANAWDNRLKAAHYNPWAWEQTDRQEQILELRRAMKHEGFDKLHPMNQCQILTNLANSFSTVGRFIEAVELWDRALKLNPKFGMARGNRGYGLSRYATGLYDHGQGHLMFVAAHDGLRSARAKGAYYEDDYSNAEAFFKAQEEHIAAHVPVAKVRRGNSLHHHSLGRGSAEKRYRSWCLRNRLFINPLNDLGPLAIAAHDVLTLPSIIRPISEPGVPAIIGFFNQMKQEFVSARYLYYDGINAEGVHFSDRGVRLYNTLDYPAYSLAAEKTRAAFRLAYSLFDKIGFFLNEYLALGIEPNQVSFRGLWHNPQKQSDPKPKTLRHRFVDYQNWPLRGLFWLSKDLFDENFRSCMEPDGADLNSIRNHLEHKYLQLHLEWGPSITARSSANELRYALSRADFQAKALRVLQLARASLIYLSLAVHREERMRHGSKPGQRVGQMFIDTWEDDWKRGDF
jgi:hypothetical protein